MFKFNWTKLTESLRGRHRLLLLFLPCVLVVSLYIVLGSELEFESFTHGERLQPYVSEDELADAYLVWNPKCHMLSINPMDASIKKFVRKERFESCSSTPLMSYISRDPKTNNISLVINKEVSMIYKNPICCWAPVVETRPQSSKGDSDATISVGQCEDFEERVNLPPEVEIVMINCREDRSKIYENVHAILNPAKVENGQKFHPDETVNSRQLKPRKLSVLLLGIDSVSRLNFKRSMPRTERYLRDTDWFHLRGYNKMGANTFPNLMAILTGQKTAEFYSKCKIWEAYGMDYCPMLWYNYRNASYVTAYGEDLIPLTTFNYLQVGFVNPPTDYYLRPYVLATEKLLEGKKRFNSKYCTGPEMSVERIFNFASEFARTFFQVPYFGFFWTNALTHDYMNGLSSMDERFREMFEGMERDGIFNDTMVIFLSDHGMRWGDIRKTFVGWYEERLPFIYIRLPEWFSAEDPQAYQALRINENRLTSPYDLYETLRDILIRAGGEANSSSGCPGCQSLFRPVPLERGCEDAGVSSHWCTCTAFKHGDINDEIVVKGAQKFLEHVENIVTHYTDENGERLCSKLKLKEILRVKKVIDIRQDGGIPNANVDGYFYLIEVSPGGGRFEVTIRYHGGDNFTVSEEEINRINSYADSASCLDHGIKQYCHCIGK